jgi:micrococcal nuclease
MRKYYPGLFLSVVFLCLAQSAAGQSWFQVSKVIDGDTLQLRSGERVRLIGIDAPELGDSREKAAAMARESRDFLRGLAEGRDVRLEYGHDKKDSYDRTLAYLYLRDGTFINAEIIKQGYGAVYKSYKFRYLDEFLFYENEARSAGKGLWPVDPDILLRRRTRDAGSKNSSTNLNFVIPKVFRAD